MFRICAPINALLINNSKNILSLCTSTQHYRVFNYLNEQHERPFRSQYRIFQAIQVALATRLKYKSAVHKSNPLFSVFLLMHKKHWTHIHMRYRFIHTPHWECFAFVMMDMWEWWMLMHSFPMWELFFQYISLCRDSLWHKRSESCYSRSRK